MQKPRSGGTPANDKIKIKKHKLNGYRIPNFFKSDSVLTNLVSNMFNSKKRFVTKKL